MVVVLYENAENTILSKLDVFYKEFPPRYRGYLGKKFKSEDLKRYEYPPLARIGWLIMCKTGIGRAQLHNILGLGRNNIYLFRITSEEERIEFLTFLDDEKVEYRFIDNYFLHPDRVKKYIMENLNVTEYFANAIYTKCNGYIRDIVSAVKLLEPIKQITMKDINNYVGSSSRYPIYSVLSFMLGLEKTYKYEEVVRVVYDYRYGFSHLKKYLKRELEMYLEVSKYLTNGLLSLSSIDEFKMKYKSTKIGKLKSSKLKKYIIDLSYVSDEYVYYLYTKVCDLADSRHEVYKIILLLKLKKLEDINE